MERFSAAAVFAIGRTFAEMHSVSNIFERARSVRFTGGEATPGNVEYLELLSSRTIREMTPDWKNAFTLLLKSVEVNCGDIGLNLAVQAAKNYRNSLESGTLKSFTEVEKAVTTLDTIIGLQLSDNLFMFIPVERAPYYARPQLFGEEVNNKFPQCQYDIEESGNCYAAGRSTACAFHLMRIMEATVQVLGTSLGIVLVAEKDWHNILEEVNKAIKNLPQKDQRTIHLARVAGNLYNVKVAWRNPTMHPKSTYTLEEAADLISSVKAFTIELAGVV